MYWQVGRGRVTPTFNCPLITALSPRGKYSFSKWNPRADKFLDACLFLISVQGWRRGSRGGRLPALLVAVWHLESSSLQRSSVQPGGTNRAGRTRGQGRQLGGCVLLKHRLLLACARALEGNVVAVFIISGGCCEGQHFSGLLLRLCHCGREEANLLERESEHRWRCKLW